MIVWFFAALVVATVLFRFRGAVITAVQTAVAWFSGIAEVMVTWYLGFVLAAMCGGFFLLIALLVGAPVWLLCLIGFPEAVLLGLLFWVRAVTADVEAEVRAVSLRGPARRTFQRRRIERAEVMAKSMRRCSALAIAAVFLLAIAPRLTPVACSSWQAVIQSPAGQLYVAAQAWARGTRSLAEAREQPKHRLRLEEEASSAAFAGLAPEVTDAHRTKWFERIQEFSARKGGAIVPR